MARGDKPYLRKSTDRKAQIRKAFVQFSGLICGLIFPIVFGINATLGLETSSSSGLFFSRPPRRPWHGRPHLRWPWTLWAPKNPALLLLPGWRSDPTGRGLEGNDDIDCRARLSDVSIKVDSEAFRARAGNRRKQTGLALRPTQNSPYACYVMVWVIPIAQ